MSRRILSSVVALGLLLSLVATAQSQPFRGNPAAQQQMEPAKTGGTLVQVGANQLQLSTNMNQTVYVMVGPNTEVTVTGKAEPDYLKANVNVEFVAEVDKTHTVKDKIIKMLIVAPTTDRPAGLFAPEFATPDKKSEKGDGEKVKPLAPDPGIGPAAPVKGHKVGGKKDPDALGDDPLTSKPSKGRTGVQKFPGTFTVRGTIKMCKDGKITVLAGKGPPIKAEVAADATIDVDTSDYRVAQPDDRVTVEGFAKKGQPNMVLAKTIKIELANPLSGAKKKASPHAKTPAAHAPKGKKDTADPDNLLGK